MREVANVYGADFATALLYDRLCKSPEHGPAIKQLSTPTGVADSGVQGLPTVAVVPGAFHVESPHTGADGKAVLQVASQCGFPVERIPTQSFGSLTRNAAILAEWLARRPAGPVVLVSLSKGGAEVKLALGRSDAAELFSQVVAWVDLSGILLGSPVVNWLATQRLRSQLIRCWFWYRGYDWRALKELRYGPAELLDGDVPVPANMKVLHVVGFPLRRHLSCPLARRASRRVAHLGPNDGGGIVLGDLCRWPGTIYPVWGADHYLKPPGSDGRELTRRILNWVAGATQRNFRDFASPEARLQSRPPICIA